MEEVRLYTVGTHFKIEADADFWTDQPPLEDWSLLVDEKCTTSMPRGWKFASDGLPLQEEFFEWVVGRVVL